MIVTYMLAAVGAATVLGWLRELWRTRNFKGGPWLLARY